MTMPEFTTIQVTTDQTDALKELPGNSYRESLDWLIANYNAGQDTSTETVTLEATEYKRIADEVEGRLRR